MYLQQKARFKKIFLFMHIYVIVERQSIFCTQL